MENQEYKQTRLVWFRRMVPDIYTLTRKGLYVEERRWPGYRTSKLSLNYKTLDSVRVKTSFWGWLFNFATIILQIEDMEYEMKYVAKGKELFNFLNKKIMET